jgi:hypothetical protein
MGTTVLLDSVHHLTYKIVFWKLYSAGMRLTQLGARETGFVSGPSLRPAQPGQGAPTHTFLCSLPLSI